MKKENNKEKVDFLAGVREAIAIKNQVFVLHGVHTSIQYKEDLDHCVLSHHT